MLFCLLPSTKVAGLKAQRRRGARRRAGARSCAPAARTLRALRAYASAAACGGGPRGRSAALTRARARASTVAGIQWVQNPPVNSRTSCDWAGGGAVGVWAVRGGGAWGEARLGGWLRGSGVWGGGRKPWGSGRLKQWRRGQGARRGAPVARPRQGHTARAPPRCGGRRSRGARDGRGAARGTGGRLVVPRRVGRARVLAAAGAAQRHERVLGVHLGGPGGWGGGGWTGAEAHGRGHAARGAAGTTEPPPRPSPPARRRPPAARLDGRRARLAGDDARAAQREVRLELGRQLLLHAARLLAHLRGAAAAAGVWMCGRAFAVARSRAGRAAPDSSCASGGRPPRRRRRRHCARRAWNAIALPRSSSARAVLIWETRKASRSPKKEVARPRVPARPVRPWRGGGLGAELGAGGGGGGGACIAGDVRGRMRRAVCAPRAPRGPLDPPPPPPPPVRGRAPMRCT